MLLVALLLLGDRVADIGLWHAGLDFANAGQHDKDDAAVDGEEKRRRDSDQDGRHVDQT